MNDEITIDGVRYKRIDRIADRVSTYGMYDCFLFHEFKGKSAEEIAQAWQAHKDAELGKTSLCPVIVLEGDKELRRVGQMVFRHAELQQWIDACNADPDIPRLLAQRTIPE